MVRLARNLIGVGASAVLLLSTGVPAAAATALPARGAGVPEVIATFGPPDGVFAESLVAGPDGAFYASVNTWGDGVGQVYRMDKRGTKRPFGPPIAIGEEAMLTGLAVDQVGRLFVAEANFAGPSRIYWVTPVALIPWVTLPTAGFVNGLAVHRGYLYATDSVEGAIYRAPLLYPTTQRTAWDQDFRLAPVTLQGLGVNGITFIDDALYVAVSDTGTIWRLPLTRNGQLTKFAEDPRLVTVDGITPDGRGGLWVTVNGALDGSSLVGQAVIDVTRRGSLGATLLDAEWMNYPTQPVLVGSTLLVENGAFDGGVASVVALPAHL